MSTLIIECDEELARQIEEAARRERKTVSEWVQERMKLETTRAASLAEMEKQALANGYPPDWMKLYGSLADEESFVAPIRVGTRMIELPDEV